MIIITTTTTRHLFLCCKYKCRLDSKSKCHKDIIMAIAKYIDNDLSLLDSVDDPEFILQMIIIIYY